MKRPESETVQSPNTITHTRIYISTRTGLAVCCREDPSAGTHEARWLGESRAKVGATSETARRERREGCGAAAVEEVTGSDQG